MTSPKMTGLLFVATVNAIPPVIFVGEALARGNISGTHDEIDDPRQVTAAVEVKPSMGTNRFRGMGMPPTVRPRNGSICPKTERTSRAAA